MESNYKSFTFHTVAQRPRLAPEGATTAQAKILEFPKWRPPICTNTARIPPPRHAHKHRRPLREPSRLSLVAHFWSACLLELKRCRLTRKTRDGPRFQSGNLLPRPAADIAEAAAILKARGLPAGPQRPASAPERIGLVRWYGGATEFEPAAPPVDTRRIFCAYRASPARVSRAQGQRD